MCRHCFDVIVRHLHEYGSSRHQILNRFSLPHARSESPDFIHDLHNPDVTCPLFVTWDKRRHQRSACSPGIHSFELRGCIGSLAPKPLVPAIGEYALLSAFRDRRFPPIQTHELEHLRVAVSLLVRYETCHNVWDWIVGTHGIIISWKTPEGQEYSSTYLPEVAMEQRWDQRTTVESLIRKAGWTAGISEALLATIQCTRYQSSKLRLTFEEYLEHCRESETMSLIENLMGNHAGASAGDVAPAGRHCRIS